MDGLEYEEYTAMKIKDKGWHVKLMPYTGDQGADIIATKGTAALAVQCKKLINGSVGNRAVQEIFTAMHFYKCEHSCVVTNRTFTASARKAADRVGVILLHHEELSEHLDWLEELHSFNSMRI